MRCALFKIIDFVYCDARYLCVARMFTVKLILVFMVIIQKATKLFSASALKAGLTEINKELSERFHERYCTTIMHASTNTTWPGRVIRVNVVTLLCSLQDVSSDLSAAMNLFDDLSNLFKPADDDSIPLLDVDCNNSIIGRLVCVCVHTCRCNKMYAVWIMMGIK